MGKEPEGQLRYVKQAATYMLEESAIPGNLPEQLADLGYAQKKFVSQGALSSALVDRQRPCCYARMETPTVRRAQGAVL